MESIKELARWLKEKVKFLIEADDEWVGSWKKLDDYFSVVVFWEEGWGKEKRTDVVQSKNNPDLGLVVGIKVHEDDETIDQWLYPWSKEDNEILTPSISIEPSDDFESLAKYILEQYEEIKGHIPSKNGSISFDVPPDEIAAVLEPEDEIEESKKLKEDDSKYANYDTKISLLGEAEYQVEQILEYTSNEEVASVLSSLSDEEYKKLTYEVAQRVFDNDTIFKYIDDITYDEIIDYVKEEYINPAKLTAEISPEEVKESKKPLKEEDEDKGPVTHWVNEVEYYFDNNYFDNYGTFEEWLEEHSDDSPSEEEIEKVNAIYSLPYSVKRKVFIDMARELIRRDGIIDYQEVEENMNYIEGKFLDYAKKHGQIPEVNILSGEIEPEDK